MMEGGCMHTWKKAISSRGFVTHSHWTLAYPKSSFSKTQLSHPSTLFSPEPSWQRTWHGLKVEVLSLAHQFSQQYSKMRQERMTFKSVTSGPCNWLLLVLAMRTQGASFNKKQWLR